MNGTVTAEARTAKVQGLYPDGAAAKASLSSVKKLHRESIGVISSALGRAGITRKHAAITMGISESLLSQQLDGDGTKHLSWSRLFLLPDDFFYELLILIAQSRGIATVRTQIDLERKRTA